VFVSLSPAENEIGCIIDTRSQLLTGSILSRRSAPAKIFLFYFSVAAKREEKNREARDAM
jgi:hypothetical protein